MKIPKTILSKWKAMQSYGDMTAISAGDKNVRVYLSNAMSKGECSVEIFIKLRDFYNERQELIETAQ